MKTILITGASSGIGLACTRKLSGGNKLILCSRSLSALENIKSETGNTKNMFVFSVDVTSQSQIRKMFKSIESLNLYPDVLINSAGIALGLEKLEDGQINEWEQMIDTNVRGLLMVSKFALISRKFPVA